MDFLELQKQIEAVLFYKGEPVKKDTLITLLDTSAEDLSVAVSQLKLALDQRGVKIVEDEKSLALATAPETKELIETMRRDELEGPLGKAGLETLAIIMYQGTSSRADIEYIRGVNSSSILRSLTMRGLIEKKENPSDRRGFIYQSTPELPAALGITSIKEIPDYEATRAAIAQLIEEKEAAEASEETETL